MIHVHVCDQPPICVKPYAEVIPASNHNDLHGRDLPDQHPISAITGLEESLLHPIEKTSDMIQPVGKDSDGQLYTTPGGVSSVNGQTGDVVLDAEDIGAYELPTGGIPASDIAPGVIPVVNNATITFTQGGEQKGSFTVNQASDTTIDFDAGGLISGAVRYDELQDLNESEKINARTNIEAITSSDSILGDPVPIIADSLKGISRTAVGKYAVVSSVDSDGNPTSWSTASGGGGGTADHADLINLDFENSGHTGFQAEITDLASIRSGASAGLTAVQPEELISYRTANDQDLIDDEIKDDISNIETLIPTQASAQNQLADKAFVTSAVSEKYQLPTTGIPATDLESSVQSALSLAATSLQPEDLNPYRTAADQTTIDNEIKDDISNIENLIPAQATSQNQLADKGFVNSSVQTASANFRGSWSTWSVVPMVDSLYPVDYLGSNTPTTNDYMVVQDAGDYSRQSLSGTWRFKYSGTWSTDNRNGWLPEYMVNEEPLTAAQIAALNSGITSEAVTAIGTKYQKPSAGIPKTDLASSVQASLDKADSALQQHQSLAGYVPTSRKVNGHALTSDITITLAELGLTMTLSGTTLTITKS